MASKKSNLLFDLEGKVVSISQTFRMLENPLYIIDLMDVSESHYILVRRKDHLAWHKEFTPGSHYKFTSLKKDVIYKKKYDIKIFTTTKDSSFTKTKDDTVEFFHKENIEEDDGLISYKGVITSVVNEKAGIFILDGDIVLIVSYLMEITAEINENPASQQDLSLIESSLFCTGDELSIFHAHLIRGREGLLTLVCCGKSLIRNQRRFFPSYECSVSNYTILHSLHMFNYGLSFLYWLCDLEKLFLNHVFKDVTPKERITGRKWKKKKGLLWNFVEKHLKDYKKGTRSLCLEFLLCEHTCVLKQDFDAPHLIEIGELLTYEKLESGVDMPKNANSPWHYSYLGKDMHKWVLFGVLCVSRVGTLRIKLNDQHIDLAVVGSKGDLYTKLNCTVAVYNFDYIHEEFDLYDGLLRKKYIILRSTDIISIVEKDNVQESESCRNMRNSSLNYYELKLKSISGMNFFSMDLKRNEISKFFMANATIEHNDIYGNKETWNNVIRFKGCITDYYPFLSEFAVIKGKINVSEFTGLSFHKTTYFSWMKSFHKQFGTIECTEVPSEFEVLEIMNYNSHLCDKIKDVLMGDKTSDYFSIKGKVMQKWFMTPKFDSQVIKVPSNFIDEGIGTPGSKVIGLLLQDLDDESYNIWVYLTAGNQFHISQYTLGLLPETIISITWLQRFSSSKGSIYLSSTLFSNISIIKFDKLKKKENNARHHFLIELSNMPSGSVSLIYATVSCILNITLKSVCSSCEYDFENGSCTFPGCHSDDGSKLAGSAKIIVDDGTCTASLFIKEIEIIKLLFFINNVQLSILSEIVDKGPIIYKYKSFKEKDSTNECIFAKIVTNPKVFRPLKITCRTFPSKGTVSNSLELFAVDLNNLNPIKDISLLRKSEVE